ncbi:hypothetical protein FHT44_005043 [Mycolicibacterium sp. BK634]|uniref:hypothetical protein n=1 Tax=Mycolicibacterium sp. BK634 TaxID=2587099 RepID=UPI001613C0BC|nr:hypothetical protein [Mycolicibacterium sp. BK634]MBB3752531.1 hypothetical protein [Mycolicibacterium sp. BK634]
MEYFTIDGIPYMDAGTRRTAEGMSTPVRCNFCGGIYDLGTVHVTQRYADCSVWKTPCCGHNADDRGESGWKSFKDYERIRL